MAINKATLAKEVDGKVEYIYPKTTADLVEYDSTQTVEQKIQSIDKDVAAVDKRVDALSKEFSSGSQSTTSDAELFDIRNPNRDVVGADVVYDSAGAAVRGQIGALSEEIAELKGDLNEVDSRLYDEITKIKQFISMPDDTSKMYSISYNLKNCTSNNTLVNIYYGNSFSATITPKSGHELQSVTCTMGGVIQSVSNGVINISSVTGNIVITASAVKDESIIDIKDIKAYLSNNLSSFALGNSFSNPTGETTSYGIVNQDMINTIANAGFNSVRIMFDFGVNHWSSYNDWAFPDYFVSNGGTELTDMQFEISTDWLDRIKEVLNYCKNAGLSMILCPMNWITPKDRSLSYGSFGAIHYAAPNNTMKKYVTLYLKKLWSQLATYFKNESKKDLLFEIVNEPLNRYKTQCGSLYDWGKDDWTGLSGSYKYKTINSEAAECLKQYITESINTIRNISSDRFILCPTYAHNTLEVWINEIWNCIKSYDNVCIAFHWYNPQAICGSNVTTGSTFNESDLIGDNNSDPYMNNMVTALNAAKSDSIPMFMTEGAVIADTTRIASNEQLSWAEWMNTNFKNKYAIPVSLFDNGVYKNGVSSKTGSGEDYGFLDRTKLIWRDSDFIKALLK